GGQRRGHAPRGVLAEHQVGGVERGEGLLVLALDRGLHRRAQRLLQRVDQIGHLQAVERRPQPNRDVGADALRRRRGGQAARTASTDGVAAAKSAAKRSALSWRDSAAEAGQVLEYSTDRVRSSSSLPSPSSATISTG